MRKFKLIIFSTLFVSIMAPLIIWASLIGGLIGSAGAMGGLIFLFGSLEEVWGDYRYEQYVFKRSNNEIY